MIDCVYDCSKDIIAGIVMALKATFQNWHDGVKAFNAGNYVNCLETLTSIAEPSSWVLYNIACTHIKSGRAEQAVEVRNVLKPRNLR